MQGPQSGEKNLPRRLVLVGYGEQGEEWCKVNLTRGKAQITQGLLGHGGKCRSYSVGKGKPLKEKGMI